MKIVYPAHIKYDKSQIRQVQTVEEHSRACALYASETPGISSLAYLAGLLHDFGKYTSGFKQYIEKAASGEAVRRGSVNHSFAGAKFAFERWHESGPHTEKNLTCEIIAAAIASHHGLFDCLSPQGEDGFLHRINAENIGYQEAKGNFIRYCVGYDELDRLFEKAHAQTLEYLKFMDGFARSQKEYRFAAGLLTRLVSSAVIDADRRDTAEFFGAVQKEMLLPPWDECLSKVEQKLDSLPKGPEINRVRREISDRCRSGAYRGDAIYRLSAPTGSGKTITGLRFALAAASHRKKRRIFFIVPLLSVLDQNAGEIREYLEDDSLILEHHSNIVQEKSDTAELDKNELLMESWNAPIVITTLLQLLNTLFSGKTSCVRRMSALADSVIVIDEVQSVPRKLLSLFNMAMNFLATACGATIVLCSATQPCLEELEHSLKLGEPPDLVGHDLELWRVFRRTEIFDRRKKHGYCIDELADFALECLDAEGSVLLICNTKSQARELFNSVKNGRTAFHLSTSMCMEHRQDTMKHINSCLDKKESVICVSTQLVEAGIDFSFGCVIRMLSGLDNIVQAAGRCNRSGEFGVLKPVYIVNLKAESLSFLKEIKQSQQAAESVLELFSKEPESFGNDISSGAAIREFYRRLYTDIPQDSLDYPIKEINSTLLSLLSDNSISYHHCTKKPNYVITQAFKTAGENFTVFDNNTRDVITPYGHGKEIIAALGSDEAKWDMNMRRRLLREARAFTVSMYDYELNRLREQGALHSIWEEAILALGPNFYSAEIGLNPEGTAWT